MNCKYVVYHVYIYVFTKKKKKVSALGLPHYRAAVVFGWGEEQLLVNKVKTQSLKAASSLLHLALAKTS